MPVADSKYLLGPWAGAVVDPTLWQLGQLAVSHFAVRHACLFAPPLRCGVVRRMLCGAPHRGLHEPQ